MQLRLKVILIIGTALAVFCWAGYEIQNRVVFPGFVALEKDHAAEDLSHCITALYNEIHHLDALCSDWAAWDDTVSFVLGQTETYLSTNMHSTTFEDNYLNLIAIWDTEGHRIWNQIRDPRFNALLELDEFSNTTLDLEHALFDYDTSLPLKAQSVKGIISTAQGPMIISSRPILSSRNKGPVHGFFMMGRFLDPMLTTRVKGHTHVKLQLWPLSDRNITAEDRAIAETITPGDPFNYYEENEETLHTYTVFPDIYMQPALLLKSTNDRLITRKGSIVSLFAGLYTMITGLFILLLVIISLQKLIVTPVARLTRHVIDLGRSHDLTGQVDVMSKDEIGTLFSEYNRTVRALSDARNRLLEQSYYSGLVEMASGIMHNIRNALTPTVLRVEILRTRFESLPVENLEEAFEELFVGNPTEERARELQKFLKRSMSSIKVLFDNTSQEHRDILKSIMHIEEILSSHELFCQANRALDHLQVEEVVMDATRFMKTKLRDSITIIVEDGLSELPSIWAERIVLIQVLTNILNNAAESILVSPHRNHQGIIRIHAYLDHYEPTLPVHIEITDNGDGMDPETLAQIFDRGFTTKEKGYTGGIGLHWCSNVITAMNGRIFAESDGTGKGATFHLILPQSVETVELIGKEACEHSRLKEIAVVRG